MDRKEQKQQQHQGSESHTSSSSSETKSNTQRAPIATQNITLLLEHVCDTKRQICTREMTDEETRKTKNQ